MTISIQDRFWSKVDSSSGPKSCWLWTAARTGNGYGNFWDGKKYTSAHSVGFKLSGGIFTKKKTDVLHKCHLFGFKDNRACCNPLHLKAGSVSENVRDSVEAKTQRNARKTHCSKGHPLEGSNVKVRKSNLKSGKILKVRRCVICERDQNKTAHRRIYAAAYQRQFRKTARYKAYSRAYEKRRIRHANH